MNRWINSCIITAVIFTAAAFISDIKADKDKRLIITDDSERTVTVTIIKKAPPKKIEKTEEKPEVKKEKTENTIAREEVKPEETYVEVPEDYVEPEDIPDDAERAEEYDEDAIYDPNAQEESVMSTAQKQQAADYKTYVLKRISAKKSYPVACRSKGETGSVKLHVIVSPDGSLKLYEIITACQYEKLNEAALKAVKKAAPFKQMKEGLKELDLIFTMEFSLTS
ncbi:TonB family protein [Treponema sp.]|uniref:TonB family protein n=1 Tax=Treponema sp. TaxID=166 RepID=UPI0025D504B1|nr:TonB family protein [Treponema sp.]MCR5218324.1 TonB family protein [Treponema sp.]